MVLIRDIESTEKKRRCLVSFFLFNETAKYDVDPKRNNLEFNYVFGEYRAEREDDLEYAIAYDEKFIRTSCYNNKLWIREPITLWIAGCCDSGKDGKPMDISCERLLAQT